MSFAPVQFYENLIARVQMKDDTVAGVVITLVLVLGDGTGPDLGCDTHTEPWGKGGGGWRGWAGCRC